MKIQENEVLKEEVRKDKPKVSLKLITGGGGVIPEFWLCELKVGACFACKKKADTGYDRAIFWVLYKSPTGKLVRLKEETTRAEFFVEPKGFSNKHELVEVLIEEQVTNNDERDQNQPG